MDRQAIKKRVSQLKAELRKVELARQVRRHKRRDVFKVAIIGYTNAGKSTLLNVLTKSEVFVEDRLFATLDPTVRSFRLGDGRKALLIDTVGFIRKLPIGLLASFKSTLEESRHADLLLHVVDISHPHWEGQLARTEEIIKELKLDATPQLLVFNKVDLVEDALMLDGLRRQFPGALFISALRGIRLHEIAPRIAEFAMKKWIRKSVQFRPEEADRLAEFERDVKVIGRSFFEGMITVDYLVPEDGKSSRARNDLPVKEAVSEVGE
jgi:GTP-binding protein HflX